MACWERRVHAGAPVTFVAEEVSSYDKQVIAQSVYRTIDHRHPGVRRTFGEQRVPSTILLQRRPEGRERSKGGVNSSQGCLHCFMTTIYQVKGDTHGNRYL